MTTLTGPTVHSTLLLVAHLILHSLSLFLSAEGKILGAPAGAFAGIVSGVLVVVALAVALGCFLLLKRIRRYRDRSPSHPTPRLTQDMRKETPPLVLALRFLASQEPFPLYPPGSFLPSSDPGYLLNSFSISNVSKSGVVALLCAVVPIQQPYSLFERWSVLRTWHLL